uniref:Uracil-DNA glycosylase n=1 Tax=Trypanosoma congolense (strain IL3000) TaxID=1068625 RepID=G0UYC4_TRYCI|nr:unnamed protein product [Trypanosoma congolense IL3000]
MSQRTLFDFGVKKSGGTADKEVIQNYGSVPPADALRKRGAEGCSADAADNIDDNPKVKAKPEGTGGLSSLITDSAWRSFLEPLIATSNFQRVEQFVEGEVASGKTILPPREMIFSAFNSTPLHLLKVVLLGQDPYHNIGQAHGLCFSVLPGVALPPSLVNMYKELATDIPGFTRPSHGYLQHWAEQGILMLNATLTVEAHRANSHSECGWQTFTDGVIRLLSEKYKTPLVFLLWGNFARKKISLINKKRHVVIECAHPSPLSAAKWWGSRPFSKCNTALIEKGYTPIDWNLPLNVSRTK